MYHLYDVRGLGDTPWNFQVPKESCPEGCSPKLSILGSIAVGALVLVAGGMLIHIAFGVNRNLEFQREFRRR